ncbi:MAG: MerR family transcriptional regulator [Patescibacteria group bacterium]
MDRKPKTIEEKKLEVDSTKPVTPSIKKSIDDFFKVETAFTSAALDGNTMTRIESLLAIEQGVTTKGKTISEHIEVVNLAYAYDFVRKTAEIGPKPPLLPFLIQIYDRVIDKLNEDLKGRFRAIPARLKGLTYVAPESSQVQTLLEALEAKINSMSDAKPPYLAAFVHGEILKISPFPLGNARVARLITQYMLLERGYAPFIIPANKRQDYLEALDGYLVHGRSEAHNKLIVNACEKGIDEYLKFFREEGNIIKPAKLLKIGELAKATKESIVTIRHYAKEGLLTVSEHTPGGYMLFSEVMVARVKEIRALQKKGLSLGEIRKSN